MFHTPCFTRLAIAVSLYCLLLGACATSPPAEYQQGAYRPAPPAFRPAQDAPHTVGQPGHVKPLTEYPRSPHKRPLPPTTEPTIYGGDDTEASLKFKPGPVFYEIPLAIPATPQGAEEAWAAARQCSDYMKSAVKKMSAERIVSKDMLKVTRRCFLAKLYTECFRMQFDREGERAASTRIEHVSGVMMAFAGTWKTDACEGITLDRHEEGILSGVATQMKALINTPGKGYVQ
jgi:hypothetical protein